MKHSRILLKTVKDLAKDEPLPRNRSRQCALSLASLACLALAAGALAVSTSLSAAQTAESDIGASDLERWRMEYERRADPVHGIPRGAYMRAFAQIQTNTVAASPSGIARASQAWTSIGPSPLLGGQIVSPVPTDVKVSGRVTGIAVDPSDMSHWFIGAVGGGIWETHDAGTTWLPRTDNQPSLEVNTLAIAPSTPAVLYGGTGNYGPFASAGIGILRSLDGGSTWTFVAPAAFTDVDYFGFAAMVVSPSDPLVVLAASSDFFGPKPSSGVFKSTDGGVTWNQKLAGVGTALVASPASFNQQYAALRTIVDGSDGSANGVYRSFDGGESWARLYGPWGTVPNGGSPILVAFSPSANDVVYICFSGQLWRSADAWAAVPSWTQIPLPADEATPSLMGADNADPTVVYIGGVQLWKLSGGQWINITGSTHVDQHSMAWAGNQLLLGNDGGLWSSTTGGASWVDHNAQLGTIQFYRGALHPTNPNFALGGSQDNGAEKWLGQQTWQWIFSGDDFSCAIANQQPDLRWAITYYYLGIQRTTDGGLSFQAADGGIEQDNRPFFSLFEKSPVADDVFITATHKLWKTTDFFSGSTVSWSENGPDIGSAITAMSFAPSDLSGQTYAFGGRNANFFAAGASLLLTTDGGTTWADINVSGSVPNDTVTGLAFAPANPNVLYVTLSGFDDFRQPGHVFKTSNALSANPTWINISPPANLPHNAVVTTSPEGSEVFVGTDIGIWQSEDGGVTWVHRGPEAGMPNVVVNDLRFSPSTGRLVAFTYGRGAFALQDSLNKCPLAQGYWKNNPGIWPVASLTLGSQLYIQAQLLALLKATAAGGTTADASLILAKQLIAAKLNIANGSDPSVVSTTIGDADRLLGILSGVLPLGVRPSSPLGQAMTADANVLDAYNNAGLTPGCVPEQRTERRAPVWSGANQGMPASRD
jgi:hypothetical protein